MQNIASIASMTLNALSMGAALTDHQSTAHAFMVAANLANTAGVYMGGQNEDKNKSWDDYFKTIPQIESFSIHSENSIFLPFEYFLFAERRFIYPEPTPGQFDNTITYPLSNGKKYFYLCTGIVREVIISDCGIVCFLLRTERETFKYYVKISDFDCGIDKIIYSIYCSSIDGVNYFNTVIRSGIKAEYERFLNNNRFKRYEIVNNTFVPKIIAIRQIGSKFNTGAQEFLIQYIRDKEKIISENKFGGILLLGEHGTGKTTASRMIAKQLNKSLYFIDNTISAFNFRSAISSIPDNCVVDISDIGHCFYDVEEENIGGETKKKLVKKTHTDFNVTDIRKILEIERTGVILIFSGNRPYLNFFRVVPGFHDRITLVVSFDVTENFEIANPYTEVRDRQLAPIVIN